MEPVELQNSAVLEASTRMVTAMGDLTAEISDLKTGYIRSRHFVRIIAVTLCVDLLISVGLTLSLVWSGQNASQAKDLAMTTQRNAVASCKQSNAVRADDVRLWDTVLGLVQANPTASQVALDQIRADVATTFAPRNCQEGGGSGR
jgi:hypothetical protein